MYLRGEKFFWTVWGNHSLERMEDDKKVSSLEVDLGYWRKHPDLHGFIVKEFANGVDECQRIDLTLEQIDTIIAAVKERRLPHTTGFFFGQSDGSEYVEDIAIFEAAKAWLAATDEAPIKFDDPEPLAPGISVMVSELQTSAKPVERQQISRSVFYRASW
jgi:hypothetical protein